ncbi:MAG TPA: sulfurtransferase, partial [Fimbriimonadaceae bacterium]|nr:sulfurtransferase [Fimbriimonadaceae bacterium]
MTEIGERGYARPDALVSTQWVADHRNDPGVVVVESNEDPLLYSSGHIPGAVEVDWIRDLNDPVKRDYLREEAFGALMSRIGATPESTIVFYGDKNNWWACYAAWVFQLFGHANCKIMDGGRLKWQKEGREMTREVPTPAPSSYRAKPRDDSAIRAFRDQVLAHVAKQGKLIDVRSLEEFTGERLHMPAYPNEGALRGGHIPGARSVPWAKAIHPEDGTFLDAADLRKLYEEKAGLSSGD